MKIGTAHRNKIWKGLIDYKNSCLEVLQTESSATTLNSQSSISQTSTYCPGYYEVTRYTFKHTISLTRETKKPRTDEWSSRFTKTTISALWSNQLYDGHWWLTYWCLLMQKTKGFTQIVDCITLNFRDIL